MQGVVCIKKFCVWSHYGHAKSGLASQPDACNYSLNTRPTPTPQEHALAQHTCVVGDVVGHGGVRFARHLRHFENAADVRRELIGSDCVR